MQESLFRPLAPTILIELGRNCLPDFFTRVRPAIGQQINEGSAASRHLVQAYMAGRGRQPQLL